MTSSASNLAKAESSVTAKMSSSVSQPALASKPTTVAAASTTTTSATQKDIPKKRSTDVGGNQKLVILFVYVT